MTTLRVTDSRTASTHKYRNYDVNGVPSAWSTMVSPTKNLGYYKSIDSEYTGAFVPGKLRMNPVTIKSGFGSVTSGTLSRLPSLGSVGNCLENEGAWGAYEGYQGALFGSWHAQLALLSKTRAHARVNAPELEVGVMLGELAEILRMLRRPLEGLVKPMQQMRKLRNKFSRSAKAVDAASNAWLQYRYGIMPLISDATAIIKQFHIEVGRLTTELKAKRAGTHTSTSSSTTFLSIAGTSVYTMRRTQVDIETISTSVVYYQYLLDLEARAQTAYWGLNLAQMPSVAWELVPYSFVVDWFVNVGDWLRAISPTVNLTKLGGCTSQKTSLVGRVSTVGTPYVDGQTSRVVNRMQDSVYTWNSTQLIRKIDTLVVATPSWQVDWKTFNRSIDALALIWQRLR